MKSRSLLFVTFISLLLVINLSAADLVSHWKLDEAAGMTAADELGASNGMLKDLTDAAWVTGQDGNAIDFDNGVDAARVVVPSNSLTNFDSTTSFTISSLVKVDPFSNTDEINILFKGRTNTSEGGEGKWYTMAFKGGQIRFAVDDNVNKTQLGVNLAGMFPANQWAHLVGVRDLAEDSLKLYLNGALIGSAEDMTELDISTDQFALVIGNNQDSTRNFKGQIDDLRMYNAALSAEDVQELFASYNIEVSNLVAQWMFDETAGMEAADVMGASNGMLKDLTDAAWVTGQDGNAIDFDNGVDAARVVVPSNSLTNFDSTTSFTISSLVKVDPFSNTHEMNILFKGRTNTSEGGEGKWYTMAFKGGQIRFAVDDNVNKTQLGVNLAGMYPVNQWAHLVGVRDLAEDSLKLYLNGALIGSAEDMTELDISTDQFALVIGNNQDSTNNFKGQIDDLRMYNAALSAEDVEELFASYNIEVSNLVAQWMFDETAGMEAADVMGASNGILKDLTDADWVMGQVGNALNFDNGVDSARVVVPSNSLTNFDSTSSFTISSLVKVDPFSNTHEMNILFKGRTNDSKGGEGKWYTMAFKGGQIRFAVDDAVNKTQLGVNIAGMYPVNQWAHLVGVRDLAEDSLKLYLNGALIGSAEDMTDLDISTDQFALVIGNNQDSTNNFKGQIDDLRMYNAALSAEDVEELFASYNIEVSNLVAQWMFDETAGMEAADVMGASNGMLKDLTDAAWVTGQDGNAIDFDNGVDAARVVVPSNSLTNFDSTTSFTISTLVKVDPISNTNEMNILFKGRTGVDAALGWEGKWYTMAFKDGQIRLAVDDNVNKTQLGVNIADIYPVNQWAHLVGVRDIAEDSLKLYLNGTLIGSTEDMTELDMSTDQFALVIGNNQDSTSNFKGQIDDLRLYNSALNAEEINELFKSYDITIISAVENPANVPMTYSLSQNYPNPFNPVTKIEFQLKKAGQTTITVYNSMGQLVATLLDKKLEMGSHDLTVRFDSYSSGIYFYQIKSGKFSQTKKMLLMK